MTCKLHTMHTSFPTGIHDIDREIISKLECRKIIELSQLNKYLYDLLDKSFWHIKFATAYISLGQGVDYKKLCYDTWALDKEQLLIYSIKHGIVKLAQHIIGNGNINMQDNDIESLATDVIRSGHTNMFQWLAEKTPIIIKHYAVYLATANENDNMDIFNFILNECECNDTERKLINIMMNRNEEYVKHAYLIMYNDVHKRNRPLLFILAAQNGYYNIVKDRLSSIQNRFIPTVLMTAANKGHSDIVRLLYDKVDYNIIISNLTYMHNINDTLGINTLCNIIIECANVVKYMEECIEIGCITAIDAFSKHDISAFNGNDMFECAIRSGTIEVVQLLFKRGYYDKVVKYRELTNSNESLIANTKNLDIINFLINIGEEVKYPDIICHINNDTIVELLLNNIDVKKEIGYNALIQSICSKNINFVQLLLARGVNIHTNDNEALIESVNNNRIDIVRLLINNGADVCARNNMTLRLAIKRDYDEIEKLLVEHGAYIGKNK